MERLSATQPHYIRCLKPNDAAKPALFNQRRVGEQLRYGGVLDDELLLALPPAELPKAIVGMQALAANGLRYPIAQYGIQADVRAGLGASYPTAHGR